MDKPSTENSNPYKQNKMKKIIKLEFGKVHAR